MFELEQNQKRRSQLEARIRTKLIQVENMAEDALISEARKEFGMLDSMFEEYLKCHSKCQVLMQPNVDGMEDKYSTDSI